MPGSKGQRRREQDEIDGSTTELPPQHQSTAFVMTLWLEPGSARRPAEWRWRVVQVSTGERRYFRRLSDLLAYVEERTGKPSPPIHG